MKRILSSQNIKYTKDLNLEELKKIYNREQFIEAVCEGCGNIFTRRLRFFSTPLCANCSKKHTALEHYGVANISQAKEVKEKKKKTFDNKNYHLEKTKKCEEKNIRLIYIFEDEWMNKQDIIKSIIKSSLGVYDRKYNARDLMFKKVGSKEAKSFLENNHIQGFCSASQHFGLYDNDRLVQCISIGLNRFSKERNLELIRMCTQLNTQVVGGFSKLIKNMFKQTGASSIESYVDRRLFSHSGYLSSGWKVDRESKPSYFYTDGKKRFNRQSFMKKRCLSLWPESDASKTEHQLCLEHGLFQIYDCGTVKMEYEQN